MKLILHSFACEKTLCKCTLIQACVLVAPFKSWDPVLVFCCFCLLVFLVCLFFCFAISPTNTHSLPNLVQGSLRRLLTDRKKQRFRVRDPMHPGKRRQWVTRDCSEAQGPTRLRHNRTFKRAVQVQRCLPHIEIEGRRGKTTDAVLAQERPGKWPELRVAATGVRLNLPRALSNQPSREFWKLQPRRQSSGDWPAGANQRAVETWARLARRGGAGYF